MTVRQVLGAFDLWRGQQQPLVLASVYDTAGSTYSKAGAQMLINADGDFQGMLSGGCLEGDLALRAGQVLRTGQPQQVTYDLGRNDEELWGLGVGCDGLMRIFLQPLHPDSSYQPFTAMSAALSGDNPQAAVTVLESDSAAAIPGQSLVLIDGEIAYSSIGPAITALCHEAAGRARSKVRSFTTEVATDSGQLKLLATLLQPPPRVLVLGAGLDAQPLVRMIAELGWRVTVQDHRPLYVERGDFAGAEQVLCVPVSEIAGAVDLDRYAAAIVMSHHLASDRQYLLQLAPGKIPYIGLLGPRERRELLLADPGIDAAGLRGRIHGPAGLDIGGRGPAAIALSIVAEMHQQLMR